MILDKIAPKPNFEARHLKPQKRPKENQPQRKDLLVELGILARFNRMHFFKLPQFHSQRIKAARKLIQSKIEAFYEKTRTPDEIYNFERSKNIINLFLNKTPDGFGISEVIYKRILNEITDSNLSQRELEKIFKRNKQQALFRKLEKQEWYERPGFNFTMDLYYLQKGLLNPNLEKLKANIQPRQILISNDVFSSSQDEINLSEIENILIQSRNLTLDDGSLLKDHYEDDKFYDLPLKFASTVYNTFYTKGNAHILNEIPEAFENMNEQELFEMFDLFSTLTKRNTDGYPKGSIITLNFKGKTVQLEAIGRGLEGSVYRIKLPNKKAVILKVFNTNNTSSQTGVTFSAAGIYGSIGILREANFANVEDVPKLYMANPVLKPVENANGKYLGGWMLVEDAKEKENGNGLKIKDWIKEKNLALWDDKEDAWVQGILVDLGYISTNTKKNNKAECAGDDRINSIYSRYLNNETTDEIIKFVQEKISSC